VKSEPGIAYFATLIDSGCKMTAMKKLLVAITVLVLAAPVLAHHGSAISYETQLEKAITMKGTVTEFVWKNPHCYILYNVKDASGKLVEWSAETSSPSSMTGEHGWSRTTVKAGDELTFTVLPSKITGTAGLLYKLVAADGKVLLEDKSRLRQDPSQQ
jgi:Family of unknown function (DUF6152)